MQQRYNDLNELNENYGNDLAHVNSWVFRFINLYLKRKTELTWGRTADGLNLWRHTKRKHTRQFQGVF